MSEAIITRRRHITQIIDEGVDISGVTARPQHVLQGYWYMPNNGILSPGSMVNRGSLSMTLNGGDSQYFSAGYYTGGTITVEESLPPATLKTETITGSTQWTVPSTIRNNIVSVRIFGGGAAGTDWYGGGGGWMNNGEIEVSPGQSIQITIGAGGGTLSTSVGGTSSFGIYLSANGGSGKNGGSGGGSFGSRGSTTTSGNGGIGYQFGGGGGGDHCRGGDGGMWGGGGGGCGNRNTSTTRGIGGNGGTYGGGGGGGFAENGGSGGIYGGNGGSSYSSRGGAQNGTNTMSNSSIPENCRGYGRAGNFNGSYQNRGGGGGGGGFGGNGGDGSFDPDESYNGNMSMSGGGGGGYGGSGGNAGYHNAKVGIGGSIDDWAGGGGGGYGNNAKGGDCGGGGGGYFAPGGNWGGGGGSYGYGGDGGNDRYTSKDGLYGGGGGCCINDSYKTHGGGGICILQYYA